MGYESRLYVRDEFDITISSFSLGCVYIPNFYDLFTVRYDGRGLYSEFGGMFFNSEYYPNCEEIPDVPIMRDKYGADLTVNSAENVLNWLVKNVKDTLDGYEELKAFKWYLKSLKKLNETKFSNYTIIHFGE